MDLFDTLYIALAPLVVLVVVACIIRAGWVVD